MPGATPGRNDPCPCGSGRKYKHCCLAAAAVEAESPLELVWQRHRRAYEGFPARMLRFIVDTYGPQALDEAWWEFQLFPEEPDDFELEHPQIPLFMPWFFHLWAPDPNGTGIEDPTLHDRPATRTLLERQNQRVDPTLRRYLERCVASPLSFHEVTAVIPGRSFEARDVLTGEPKQVQERSASKTLRVGDLLFAQLVSIDGLTILEAAPPFSLPPIEKLAVIELRKKIAARHQPIEAADLLEWDAELREIYLAAADRILHPQPQQLCNTDGDPLLPHRLIFDLEASAEAVLAAFEALRPLADDEDAADALQCAKRDSAGHLRSIDFDWIRRSKSRRTPQPSTVLGHIEIRTGRLVCEVNSARRAAAFRRHVKKALPTLARFRVAEIESIERTLAEAASGNRPTATLPEPPPPALQEQISQLLAQHYEQWVHDKIPALGNRTPLAAMRDPDGREQVEALVRSIERDGPRMTPPLDPAIAQRLRERLGLGEG